MTYRRHTTIYGRRHLHDHVRALSEWKKKKNPSHTLSEEYDTLLVAGIKALYQQDVPLNPEPDEPQETPPAPAVAAHG